MIYPHTCSGGVVVTEGSLALLVQGLKKLTCATLVSCLSQLILWPGWVTCACLRWASRGRGRIFCLFFQI